MPGYFFNEIRIQFRKPTLAPSLELGAFRAEQSSPSRFQSNNPFILQTRKQKGREVKWLVWGLPVQVSRACLGPYSQTSASPSHSPAHAARGRKAGSCDGPRGELRESCTETGAKKMLRADPHTPQMDPLVKEEESQPCTPHSHLVTFPGWISVTWELSIIL